MHVTDLAMPWGEDDIDGGSVGVIHRYIDFQWTLVRPGGDGQVPRIESCIRIDPKRKLRSAALIPSDGFVGRWSELSRGWFGSRIYAQDVCDKKPKRHQPETRQAP